MPRIVEFRIFIFWLALLACQVAVAKDGEPPLSKGQQLYLPIYSQVWHGDRHTDNGEPTKSMMSALVSIRNTSLKTPIRVTSARYYNTAGNLLKEYIAAPKTVAPMETLELFIEKKESEGGSGANFVIQWEAATLTNPPIVEAVHIDSHAGRPYSFITGARVIYPEDKAAKKK